MATLGTVRYAEEVEADAAQYPEERGEVLLEAAFAWKEAGRPDQARRIVDQLVTEGGEDGRLARADRIEQLIDDDDWAAAWDDAAVLARDPDLGVFECELVAEILGMKGELEQSLAWYDRAVARIGEDEWAALRVGDRWSFGGMSVLSGRRDVRERLGLPEDVADALVVPPPGPPPPELPRTPVVVTKPPGRNEPCSCGSGVKYKKCCGRPG